MRYLKQTFACDGLCEQLTKEEILLIVATGLEELDCELIQ